MNHDVQIYNSIIIKFSIESIKKIILKNCLLIGDVVENLGFTLQRVKIKVYVCFFSK